MAGSVRWPKWFGGEDKAAKAPTTEAAANTAPQTKTAPAAAAATSETQAEEKPAAAAAHVATPEAAKEAPSSTPKAKPPNIDYYDLLGVPWTATSAEIKKGYYKSAMTCHPDKHPGDTEAEEKFKRVGEAYHVLSTPDLKERYDRFGLEAIKDSANVDIDPKAMFNVMFGGGKFEEFVGELGQFVEDAFAAEAAQEAPAPAVEGGSTPAQAPPPPPPSRSPEAEAKRLERVTKLTTAMLARLQPFVDGDTAGFQRTASTLAGELVEESFGPEMLEALGYYYELKGMQYLGATKLLGLAGMYHGARERVHAVKEAVGVVSYGVDLQMAAQQRQMHEEKGTLNEETLRKLEQEMAAKMIGVLWAVNKMEMESVLRDVCANVLHESSASKAVLRARAEGLKVLGRTFRAAARGKPSAIQQLLGAGSGAPS